MILIAATVIVSLSAILSDRGRVPVRRPSSSTRRPSPQGEYWRLFTVTLLHGSLLHLFFNMYALYLAGPIVERWYGSVRFLLFYLACAAAGSVSSFVFGGDVPSVGASGAIFGLFGVLLAAGRVHHPVDRQSRALVGQLGMLILINIAFGFAVTRHRQRRAPRRAWRPACSSGRSCRRRASRPCRRCGSGRRGGRQRPPGQRADALVLGRRSAVVFGGRRRRACSSGTQQRLG